MKPILRPTSGPHDWKVFLAEPDKQAAIEAALPELPRVRFDFEHNGSTVLFEESGKLPTPGG